ncbi:FixH family protein [Cryomorphaceae bacterium 1068]|nr:FixH family protein [Cryomorphaceae bacterium 1068]
MNWGHKIAIVYGLFVAFMIGMLIMSMNYDNDLVTEDYYAKELAYQDKIDAGQNLAQADFDVEVKMVDGKLKLLFDRLPAVHTVSGEVKFYKPDNEKMDETHPIIMEANSNEMEISSKGKQGRYKVQVTFELEGKSFYKEQELVL